MGTATLCCAIIRVDMATTAEQLDFTAWPADHQDTLSTSFSSKPSPLILDGNCTVSKEMGERLALAVSLARRDLQRSLQAHRTMLGAQQMQQDTQIPDQTAPIPVQTAPIPDQTAPISGQTAHQPTPNTGQQSPVPHQSAHVKVKERNALVGLEKSLAQHVHRLQQLCIKEEEENECDDEIEKPIEHHVSTLNRKIYDLEQKMNQRLAAAHRTATRILNSLSSSFHPLPNELLRLLGMLCEDENSSQLLILAQKYSDDLRIARQKIRNTKQKKKLRQKIKVKRRPYYTVRPHHTFRPDHTRPDCTVKPNPTVKRHISKNKSYRNDQHTSVIATSPISPIAQSPPSHLAQSPPSPPQSSLSPPSHTPSHIPQSPPTHNAVSSYQPQVTLPHLVTMTTTLKLIEEEQSMICSKWNQQHSPDHISTYTYTLKQEQDPTEIKELKTPVITRNHCQQNTSNYSMLECVADSLLNDIMNEICSEISNITDSLASHIFAIEFHATSS